MAVAVIVFVEDVARSLAFYEHVLGAELDHFDEDGSYGELKSGIGFAAHGHVERHLDLSFHRNEPGGLPSGFELELAVDDVDAAFAKAIDAGATAVWEPRDKPWGRSALIRDLDGVFVHLTQA
jgi:predicted enzyme related to lactoylglutathione lyase